MNAVRCRARAKAGFGDACAVGTVLSQTSSVPSRIKASKLTRFLILLSSRTEPQPNSRGENLNLRYNLAKRSVELLLRVRDEI